MILKFGHITNVNDDNHVVVQLDDADGVTTDYIPFLVHNPCFKVNPVVINALVAVLIDDTAQEGVCLGYVNSQELSKDTAYIAGDLHVSGNVYDGSGSMQSMRSTYNSHTHTDEGTSTPTKQM